MKHFFNTNYFTAKIFWSTIAANSDVYIMRSSFRYPSWLGSGCWRCYSFPSLSTSLQMSTQLSYHLSRLPASRFWLFFSPSSFLALEHYNWWWRLKQSSSTLASLIPFNLTKSMLRYKNTDYNTTTLHHSWNEASLDLFMLYNFISLSWLRDCIILVFPPSGGVDVERKKEKLW